MKNRKSAKRLILVLLLAVLVLGVVIAVLVQQALDRAHKQEAKDFKLGITLSVDQFVTAPGEPVTFTASATGGKGLLQYEFYYMNGEEKVVVRERSEHNTVTFTKPDLGIVHMMVSVTDDSPWTEDTSAECRYGAAHAGIDVSVYQKQIDWAKVEQSGVEFVMLRAGFGHYNPDKSQQDANFAANIQGAHAAGLKVGAYHFSYAMTPDEARAEAEFCLSILEPYRDLIDYPIAFDIEREEQQALSEQELTAIVRAFCEPVREAGYTPIIYTYDSWLQSHPGWEKLQEYDIWAANWATAPKSDFDPIMWQYTNKGRVDGIDANVDLNHAFADYEKGVKKPS